MEEQKENAVQPYGTHGRMLTYAYGEKKDKLLYIDDVPNGAKCGCFCPCCKKPLNAHNGGKIRQHHFAHQSCCDCKGYYETTLHKLAKEIISEEKCVMFPKLGILPSEMKAFELVEVEKLNTETRLKPDCTCTTKDGWVLWIEILVTHPVSEEKAAIIKQNGINCLEINISNQPLDKEILKEFIVNSSDSRHFVNYPYREEIIRKLNDGEYITKTDNPEILITEGTNFNVIDCYKDSDGVWHYLESENGTQKWVTRPKELKKPEINYDAWIFKCTGLSVEEIRKIEGDFYVTRMDDDYKKLLTKESSKEKTIKTQSKKLSPFRYLSQHEIKLFKEITEIQRVTLKHVLMTCYHKSCYLWSDEEWENYIHGNPFIEE
jgi:hypothetical protein